MKSPELYDHSLNCSFVEFDGGYFAFPLIDSLYPIAVNKPPIGLGFMSKEYKKMDVKERCSSGLFIKRFKISASFVWLAILNASTKELTVIKHNRSTGENRTSEVLFPDALNMQVDFDPVNPDYILYPGRSGHLYRRMMF